MKKSLFSMSMAALLASASVTAWASSVTIPNSFTAGSTAVAADVNANFDAVAASVNDNDSRVTTNATTITANGITPTSDHENRITANEAAVSGNGLTPTSDHENRITANEAAISGVTSCPDGEMVAVGPLCVDIYEASIWDTPTGGTPIAASTCELDGSDCSKNAANPIYAQSVVSVNPAVQVTWYQAVQACANVGKRLPTTAEWLMAANGTPAVIPPDRASGCNVNGISGGKNLGTTGESAGSPGACVSSAGAFDMLGNVWEWSADLIDMPNDLNPPNPDPGFEEASTDGSKALILGSSYKLGIVDTHSVSVADSGPLDVTDTIGFRCVR